MDKILILAGVLYSNYCQAVGGFSVTGTALPTWEELVANEERKTVVEGWKAAAAAAIQHTTSGAKLRAKMVVHAVNPVKGNTDCNIVSMLAVTNGSEYTPSGQVILNIDNQAEKEFFEPGSEYYLDFHKA